MYRRFEIIHNLGIARQEQLMGEDYFVCPVRMIVSGVLQGSEGPLYYPPDEIANSVNDWNGVPIVIYHPVINDQNVSARNPLVWSRSNVGWVFNCTYNAEYESLDGEAWISFNRLSNIDKQLPAKHQIIPRIKANIPIEVSTGLGTYNEPSSNPNNIDPKSGKAYTHVARHYKPDHLAILPDVEGACSVNDGCGLGIANQKQITDSSSEIESDTIQPALNVTEAIPLNLGVTNMPTLTKNQLVSFVCNNCDCWKGDEKTLNSFTEQKLKKLYDQIIERKLVSVLLNGKKLTTLISNKKTKNADGKEGEVMDGVDLAALAQFLSVEVDPGKDPVGFIAAIQEKLNEVQQRLGGTMAPSTMQSPPNPDEPNLDDEQTDVTMIKDPHPGGEGSDDPTCEQNQRNGKKKTNPNTSNQGRNKPMTRDEWFNLAPPEVREVVNQSITSNQRRKKELIDFIVNTQTNDDTQRNMLRPIYEKMSIPDLEQLVATSPRKAELASGQPQYVEHFGSPLFIGNGGPPIQNTSSDVADLIPLPWDH